MQAFNDEKPRMIHALVPESLAETIRRTAFEKRTSVSKVVRDALEDTFVKRKKQEENKNS